MSWVYIEVGQRGKGIFQVGFYDSGGTWHADTDHGTSRASAAARVNYLNGGTGPIKPPNPPPISAEAALRKIEGPRDEGPTE